MADLSDNTQWTTEQPLIVDNRTKNRGYLQPYPDNPTAVDCARISTAFESVDSDVANLAKAQSALSKSIKDEVDTEIAELKRNTIKGAILEITIPNIGWQKANTDVFFVDVALDGCTGDLVPSLSINAESWNTAYECGLHSAAQTLDDALRVFAQLPPEQEMSGTLVLLGAGCTIKSSNVIEVGAGLSLLDGVLTLKAATTSDVDGLFESDEIAARDVVVASEGMAMKNGVLRLDLATAPDVDGIFGDDNVDGRKAAPTGEVANGTDLKGGENNG